MGGAGLSRQTRQDVESMPRIILDTHRYGYYDTSLTSPVPLRFLPTPPLGALVGPLFAPGWSEKPAARGVPIRATGTGRG
jgi:hypothetical protein